MVEGDFTGDGAIVLKFGVAVAGGFVHFVEAFPCEVDASLGMELSKQSDPLSLARLLCCARSGSVPGNCRLCKNRSKKQQEVCLGSAKSVCFDNALRRNGRRRDSEALPLMCLAWLRPTVASQEPLARYTIGATRFPR
jgi:hypothetical protein